MLEYKYLWLVEKQSCVEKVLGTCPSDSRFLGFYVIDDKYICYENIQYYTDHCIWQDSSLSLRRAERMRP